MIHIENSSFTELNVWFWLCFALTAASALTSLGFSLAALRGPNRDVYAKYSLSRSIALVGGVIVVLAVHTVSALFVMALAMTVVQALDAVVGITISDRMKTFGPAALAVLTLAAALLLGP
ncbi:hypothetical protein [Subtercola lobariae]|uniref:Uncharacterized protein n=1 Tax=Subtercola lobariae TaxID=1588641 RepID=A0A917EXN5_9MICO|nr:hypothetical protein [Subtercola lobariae]GGF21599.1 hypothetical protein GCM10011399_14140 [Subtercola lobariae]